MRAGDSQVHRITADAIEAWLANGAQRQVLPRVNEALDWAKSVWADAAASADVGDAFDPDRLHALVRVVYEDDLGDPRRIQTLYHAVEAMAWPTKEFDERLDLLSQLAYLVSRQYRRADEPRLSWAWGKKAVALVRDLPSVSEFLVLTESQRTDQLRGRFLMDPCLLLALCASLHVMANLDPSELLRQAIATRSHLMRSRMLNLDLEERAWFLVQLEILSAIGHKHFGNPSEAERWLDLAAARCDLVRGADISRTLIDFYRRSLAYDRRNFDRARAGLAQVAERFDRFGMRRYVGLCAFLEGVTLKEVGLHAEALAQLHSVSSDESLELEDWIRGLALIHAADLCARQGEGRDSIDALSKAWGLVGESGIPTATAHFHAVKGEILRDLGHLDVAIQSYQLAVATYEVSQYKALETLLRIVLAETLLAAGRDGEALSEIVVALQIAETLGLVQEGVVAVALLRESLSRHYADREALVTLKRALESPNEGNR